MCLQRFDPSPSATCFGLGVSQFSKSRRVLQIDITEIELNI